MNATDFITAIKAYVTNSAIRNTTTSAERPVGRKISEEKQLISSWFNSLNQEEKKLCALLMKEAVDDAIFGILCVIDGVRVIEETEEKSEFELVQVKHGERNLINKPDENYLHDIYNANP
jgi:hypothetical protein